MITVEFSLYGLAGLSHRITVTSPDPEALVAEYDDLLRKLEARGFGEKEPDPSMAPRYERIVGWVLGEANTKIPGETQTCVYLYNDVEMFTFKTATVYAERLKELPLGDLASHKAWTGEPGAAPLRATAKTKGYLNPCDFTIILVPKVDFKTGKPLTKPNSRGEESIQYKFVRVSKVHRYPLMTFTDPAQAITWAVSTGVFPSEAVAKEAYDQVRETTKPPNAAAMWKNWVAVVNSKLEDEDV